MQLLIELIDYLSSGGFVMPPLILATFLLWYALGYRYAVMLKAGHTKSVRNIIEAYEKGKFELGEPAQNKLDIGNTKTGNNQIRKNKTSRNLIEQAVIEAFRLKDKQVTPIRKYLDYSFWELEKELSRYQVLVKTIVSITPLLGLLGTVGGMIETFDSLRDMELFSQTGGIAGGIAQALVTTQFGLAVAIPGLLVNGYLNRKKLKIEMDLAQIKDLMSVKQANLHHYQ